MKNIFLLLITALVFSACGDQKTVTVDEVIATNDLKQIRTKKATLDRELQDVLGKIKQLNVQIEKLDTLKRNPLVTAINVQREAFVHYLELQGNVQTKQNVLIYPEMPGMLEQVHVKEGQQVSKGQLLGKIDDGGMAEQVAQLEATTALAKTTFERQERLWKQKIGSEIQFLQAKTNFEAQKRTLAQVKAQLEKASLIAPFSGVIDEVIKNEGSVVAPGPGSEIFRIINLDQMYIEAAIPETYLANVTVGKSVQVAFPVLGKVLSTKVRQTGNFINPNNRTFRIEIAVPNKEKNIKPNLTAKIKINDYTSAAAILIPQSIISENANGEQYVYRITGVENGVGTAQQTIVKTGKTQGDVIEILDGINVGDQIIEAGARSVKDGQKVKISKA